MTIRNICDIILSKFVRELLFVRLKFQGLKGKNALFSVKRFFFFNVFSFYLKSFYMLFTVNTPAEYSYSIPSKKYLLPENSLPASASAPIELSGRVVAQCMVAASFEVNCRLQRKVQLFTLLFIISAFHVIPVGSEFIMAFSCTLATRPVTLGLSISTFSTVQLRTTR